MFCKSAHSNRRRKSAEPFAAPTAPGVLPTPPPPPAQFSLYQKSKATGVVPSATAPAPDGAAAPPRTPPGRSPREEGPGRSRKVADIFREVSQLETRDAAHRKSLASCFKSYAGPTPSPPLSPPPSTALHRRGLGRLRFTAEWDFAILPRRAWATDTRPAPLPHFLSHRPRTEAAAADDELRPAEPLRARPFPSVFVLFFERSSVSPLYLLVQSAP